MMSYKSPGNAAYNGKTYGPTFGGGHDLHLADNCHSTKNSYTNLGHSYQTPKNYKYGGNAKTMLAGSYNFKCTEYEVYYLVTESQKRALEKKRVFHEKQNKRLRRTIGASQIMKGQSLTIRRRLHEFIRGLSGTKKEWTRCYLASNHDFRAEPFHNNCNNKGPTITLVRSGSYTFGAYNPSTWICKYSKFLVCIIL